jgi:hypothetical protein
LFDHWLILCYGIGTRNSHGDYDKNFYESVELPSIIDKLKNAKNLKASQFISCVIMVYSMKTKDREIHQLILKRMREYEAAFREKKYDVADSFVMKGMHQWLSYGIVCGIIPQDLVLSIVDVSNRLTALCLCNRHMREFDSNDLGNLPADVPEFPMVDQQGQKPRLLDCINDEASSAFVKQRFLEPKIEDSQFYGDNYNEQLIKEILLNFGPTYFEMPFELLLGLEAIQACTYKWDAVLKFRDIPEKIGFEVSGQAYTSDFSGFQQKKKIKMQVLAQKGFIPVIIDVGSSKMKGYILESNHLMAAIYIIQEIRLQVKKQSGIELNIRSERQAEYDRLVQDEKNIRNRTMIAKTKNLAANNQIISVPRKAAKTNVQSLNA